MVTDKASWEMPHVDVGEIVYYKSGLESRTWTPFLVSAVARNPSGEGHIAGFVGIFRTSTGAECRDMVLHIDDPRLQDPTFYGRLMAEGDGGIWDYAPWTKRLQQQFNLLRDRISSLEKIVRSSKA
jgi:hypothetical protein